jgi:hypothetical protein
MKHLKVIIYLIIFSACNKDEVIDIVEFYRQEHHGILNKGVWY